MLRLLLILTSFLIFSQSVQAAPELPQDPRAWINSRPLSLDTLKGKAVVLYFFEEQCPSCMRYWPDLIEASLKFQGEPVIFIAVNSGNSRTQVQSYVRKTNIPWPVIVDSDRSLEKAFDLPKEISLESIMAMRVVKADGEIGYGNPGDFEESVEATKAGAAWKVDPETLPEELLPAWKEIELGDYQTALPMLKRPLASRKEEIKEGAQSLQKVVLDDLQTERDKAKSAEELDDIWEAFKLYSQMAVRFEGYEGSEQAEEKAKEYSKHEKVKNEQDAFKKMASAKRSGSKGDERSVKRAIGMLEKLVEDYPGTDASREAQDILARVKNPLAE